MAASAASAFQELGTAGASAFVLSAKAMRTANDFQALHNRHRQGRYSGLERTAHHRSLHTTKRTERSIVLVALHLTPFVSV